MMILWTNGLLIKSWMQPMGRANGATTNFCATMYGHSTLNGSPEEIEDRLLLLIVQPSRLRARQVSPDEWWSLGGEAVEGLKFSECLPRSLATEVVTRRLAAPESTARALKNASSNGATQPDRCDSEALLLRPR
jgi:hypothetical protein